MNSWKPIAVCVGLAALVWMVFGQTTHHQFVNYDDPLYVLENPHVNTRPQLANRPVGVHPRSFAELASAHVDFAHARLRIFRVERGLASFG